MKDHFEIFASSTYFFLELRKVQGKASSEKLNLHPQFDHILNFLNFWTQEELKNNIYSLSRHASSTYILLNLTKKLSAKKL